MSFNCFVSTNSHSNPPNVMPKRISCLFSIVCAVGCRTLLAGFFLLTLSLCSPGVFAADVTLGWDPNIEEGVEGYGVYFSQNVPGPPYSLFGYIALDELNNSDSPNVTVTALEKGSRYYFAVTAYDSSGNESAFSNSVCADIGDVITPCSGASLGGGGGSSGSGGGGGGGCFIESAAARNDQPSSGVDSIAAVIGLGALLCFGRKHLKRSFALLKQKKDNRI